MHVCRPEEAPVRPTGGEGQGWAWSRTEKCVTCDSWSGTLALETCSWPGEGVRWESQARFGWGRRGFAGCARSRSRRRGRLFGVSRGRRGPGCFGRSGAAWKAPTTDSPPSLSRSLLPSSRTRRFRRSTITLFGSSTITEGASGRTGNGKNGRPFSNCRSRALLPGISRGASHAGGIIC